MSEEFTEKSLTTPSEVADTTSTNEPISNDTTSSIVEPESNTEAVEGNSDKQGTSESKEKTATNGEELILGKYKTIEDAAEGLKNQQALIDKKETEAIKQLNETVAKYEEMFQQAGFNNPQQFRDAQVQSELTQVYNDEKATIDNNFAKEVAKIKKALDDGEISEAQADASYSYWENLKIDAYAEVKADHKWRLNSFKAQQEQAKQEQQSKFKSTLYEQHKDHADILDLFFDAQPTPEKAIALKEAIAKQAVENYKLSLETVQANKDDLTKLSNVGNLPKTSEKSLKNLSFNQITKLQETDPAAFAKWCKTEVKKG